VNRIPATEVITLFRLIECYLRLYRFLSSRS